MSPKLRVSFISWIESVRQIVTAYNVHRHEPFSDVQSVSISSSLDDNYHTTLVTASGTTQTLPAASSDRVGIEWTVILGVSGNVTIQTSGSDTIYTAVSTASTSIEITQQGDSLTFRCVSSSSWAIV